MFCMSSLTKQVLIIGYSLIREPLVYHYFLGSGTRISVIAALSTEGLACYELITGTTNGDKLYAGAEAAAKKWRGLINIHDLAVLSTLYF